MAQQYKGSVLLLLTAMIWGAALVAQSVSMDLIGPFTFQCARSILGALVLLPVIAVFSRDKGGEAKPPVEKKTQWIAGLLCGVIFFAACGLQQCGLVYTTAGKAGFITALYIVLVPIAGIFFHRKVGWNVWTGVVIGVVGLYLLCVTEGFSIAFGDLLVMVCELLFAVHILVIDYFSPRADGVKLSCIQFFTCGLFARYALIISGCFQKCIGNTAFASAVSKKISMPSKANSSCLGSRGTKAISKRRPLIRSISRRKFASILLL